jgi:CheY-like chemotaxis protein
MARRILLVDDEDHVRRALRRALAPCGFEVLEAADGQAALDLLRVEDVDLILLDLMMPGMDGLTFLEHARVLRPATARVVLTGHADLHTALRAINQGAVQRFLLKPWGNEELRVVVQLLMRESRARRETLGLAQAARALVRGKRESGAVPVPAADDPSSGALVG